MYFEKYYSMSDEEKIAWLERQLTSIAEHPAEADKVFIDSDFFRPQARKEYENWKVFHNKS